MKLLLLLSLLAITGCSTEKRIPNYDNSKPGKQFVWRYTSKGEPVKDILSTGDTLVTSTACNCIYVIKGRDTSYILKPL